MTTPPRGITQQDFHEEQSTVEITCSGFDEQTEPNPDAPFATGIYVRSKNQKFLVTNWHVVTGKNPETQEMLGTFAPRQLKVREIIPHQGGRPRIQWIPLYTPNGTPAWIESTKNVNVEGKSQKIDLAIIPLPFNTILGGLNVEERFTGYIARPLDQVTVIGFPYKRDRPIWKTANIAESVQPYQDYFLINGRTKSGMSGSGVFSTTVKAFEQSTRLVNGLLLGIYSGRYNDRGLHERLNDLDIGIVWKIDLVETILKASGKLP
jgi:hypothetical protein